MAKKKTETDYFPGIVRILTCVAIVGLGINFTMASWTAKKEPPQVNEEALLKRDVDGPLKDGETIAKRTLLRGKLILHYINRVQLVEGLKQLKIYKEWIDKNQFSTPEAIELHSQLALIHMSLNEIDAAVKQYDLILNILEPLKDFDSRVARARYLNDRGVANFLRAQAAMLDADRKQYFADSRSDFNSCQEQLTTLVGEGHLAPNAGSSASIAAIGKLLNDNQKLYSNEMLFTAQQVRPEP